MPRLTKRTVDSAKPRSGEYFIWCSATPGFAIRVYPSGKKVFISQVRVGRATRRVKIGVYGPYTVEQARRRAEEISRIAAEGRDPQRDKLEARSAMSVAELCDAYLRAARADLVITRFGRPKRRSTLAVDEGRILRHIKPLIGALRARDVTRADVQRMVDNIAQGRRRASLKARPAARQLSVAALSQRHAW